MTMFIIIMVIIIMCSKTAVLRPPVFSSRVSLDSRLSRFHNFDTIHQQYISKQVHLPSIWSSPRFFQNRIVTLMEEETRKRQVACRRRFENVTSWKGQKTIDWNAKWEGSQKLGVGSKSMWLFFGWILDSKNEFCTRVWQFYLDMARRWGRLLLLSVPHTTTPQPHPQCSSQNTQFNVVPHSDSDSVPTCQFSWPQKSVIEKAAHCHKIHLHDI